MPLATFFLLVCIVAIINDTYNFYEVFNFGPFCSLLSFFFHVQVCMPPTLCALQLRTGFLSGLSHCKYIVTFLSRDWLTPPYPTFSPTSCVALPNFKFLKFQFTFTITLYALQVCGTAVGQSHFTECPPGVSNIQLTPHKSNVVGCIFYALLYIPMIVLTSFCDNIRVTGFTWTNIVRFPIFLLQ